MLNVALILLLRTYATNAILARSWWNEDDQSTFLTDAGCTVRSWKKKPNGHRHYSCEASGNLLEKGACTPYGYRRKDVPEKGHTKVHTTINHQKVRAVDDKDTTVSIDFAMTMRWIDHRISTNFSAAEDLTEHGGIGLDISNVDQIWQPDLYIHQLSDYKAFSDSKQFTSLEILKDNSFDENEILVVLVVEAKATVYCPFNLDRYPIDKQVCNFQLGSRSSGVDFVLHDPDNNYHNTTSYTVANFNMTIDFFDGEECTNGELIGLKIQMDRIIAPFVYEYYLPCIAIVLVSGISFVIPLTAIPGRVALLVTVFLTLTNLFIHQTVIF